MTHHAGLANGEPTVEARSGEYRAQRLSALRTHSPTVVALVILTAVIAAAVLAASRTIDGRRYFWLDDDQMISMRYARNLVEGHGLVWNPGERVEGYTSLGWTLVMAVVHLSPFGTATTSLAVKVINWLLACVVLLLSARLLRVLAPHAPAAAFFAVLVPLALGADVVFWAANGFETTLLTVVFLWALVRILDEADARAPRPITFVLIGLLPIARSDAYPLWAALMIVAFACHGHRSIRRYGWLALLAPVLQIAFRVAYYGDWLPNTYYLKVYGMGSLYGRGASYLKYAAEAYAVALIVAAAGVVWLRDRRLWWIAAAAVPTALYVARVGGDVFPHFRFFAPWVPVLLVMAAAAACRLSQHDTRLRAVLLAVIAISTIVQAGIHGPGSAVMASGNGLPEHGLVVGLLVERFTPPDTTVAVFAAGNVPYFSRRPALDLLGKSDRAIAHLPARRGPMGHSKFDMEYSLSKGPDLIVTPFDSESATVFSRPGADLNFVSALFQDVIFNADYRAHSVPLDYLRAKGAVYVRGSSIDRLRPEQWVMPVIRP